jgi:hypothetical protein
LINPQKLVQILSWKFELWHDQVVHQHAWREMKKFGIKKNPAFARDFVAQKGLITNDLRLDLADLINY